MRLSRFLPLIAAMGVLAPLTFAGTPQDVNFTETIYSSGTGLNDATAMAWATDGSDTLFVAQKGTNATGGHLRVIRNAVLQTMDFATVSPIETNSECGLINVVVDPSYATNGYVYVFATTSTSAQRIYRFTATVSGSNLIGTGQLQIGPTLPTVGQNHDGGGMAISPVDGYLYWGVGNLGNNTGQDGSGTETTSYASKICRMDRFTGNPIAGGPFTSWGTTVGNYVFAKGFRNPFGLRFHPTTGALWLTEVGDSWEQIFLVTSGSTQGYPTENNMSAGRLIPKFAYTTGSATYGNCLTRGIFYNGTQFPLAYRGDLYFTDYGSVGRLHRAHVTAAGDAITTVDQFVTNVGGIVDVSIGPDGALYYVTRGSASVYRLAYTGPTQNLVVSPATLNLPEGTTGVFNVRLAIQPPGNVTVNIARTSGDVNLTAAPTPLTFTTGNWNVNQPVTVTSVATPNGANEVATFTVSSTGLVSQTVQVTATDAGVPNAPTATLSAPTNGQIVVGTNLDFYGSGSAVAPSTLVRAEFSIDGGIVYTDPYDPLVGHFHYGGAHTAWNSALTPDGPHTLTMTVFDSLGRSGSAQVDVYIANATAVYQQSSAADGVLTVEAELYSNAVVSPDGHTWVLDGSFAGFSGSGAMRAMPDSGTNNTGPGGYTLISPRLDYVVNFTKTGTHYVWVRGIGPSGLGNDDSVHVGLDGAVVAAAERISSIGTTWTWTNQTMIPSVATINVASTGPHVVNVWMREDGFAIDKLLLTVNAAYPAPGGMGPAPSTNIGGGAGGGPPPVPGGGGGGGGGGCGATGLEYVLLAGLLALRRRGKR